MADSRSVFSVIQPTFNAGELSPLLFGRVDIEKYKSGLALARNVFIDYHGGLSNRPGTQYVATIPGLYAPRGLPFVVNTAISYSVVFTGNGLIQFFSNGAYITGADLASPYAQADEALVKYNQSADVMTLTHPSYPAYELTRTSPTTFALAEAVQGPEIDPPTALTASHSVVTNANEVLGYVVTAVSSDGKEESLPTLPFFTAGADISADTSQRVRVSWVAPAQEVSYYKIYRCDSFANRSVSDVSPMPAPSVFGLIGTAQSTTFTDTNFVPDFSQTPPQFQDPFSPGQIATVSFTSAASTSGYTTVWIAPLVFTAAMGDPGTGAAGYAIIDPYTDKPFATVLTNPGKNYAVVPTVTDTLGDAVYSCTLGQLSGTYPGTSTYFQQRRLYGGTDNFPESLVMSVPGKYSNFDTSPITNASDSITASISSTQNNTIKSMVPISLGLIVFTYGSAFLISGGGQGTAVTPSSIVALPQASFGASDLPPIPINYTVMYTEALGFTVRDLTFNFYNQAYVGVDRSVLSSHLFFGYSFLDWGFAQAPFRLLHMTRNDGTLLVMTYAPEQEMFAWTHYDTNGQFVSVWTVPEGQTNAVYCIVKRYIQGTRTWMFFLERFVERIFQYPIDLGMWFVDAGLSLPQNAPSNTLQLGSIVASLGEFTYSGSPITASVGDIIQAYGCQFEVLSTDGTSSISVQLLFGTPPAIPNDPFGTIIPFTSGNWTITTPVTTVTGLDYLDGMYVTGVADGVVIPPTRVVGGSIALPEPATSILLGLGYTAQVQTLRLTAQGTIEEGKRKNIPAITLRQYLTAGVEVGKDFSSLVPQKTMFGPMNPQVQLASGDIRSVIGATWTKDGQVCFQQSLPLPMTILADIPEVVLGDTYRG